MLLLNIFTLNKNNERLTRELILGAYIKFIEAFQLPLDD